MVEQDLEITENKGYKNISLKPNPAKGRDGLKDGNHVIVTKNFAEGRPINMSTYTIYSCGVRYKDEDVSFILNEKEHSAYANTGGVGDKVKITLRKETFTNPINGNEQIAKRLYFEKVE